MRGHRKYRRSQRPYRRRSSLKERLRALTAGQGIYRSRKGMFMGVCRGLADHFDFNVFWVRLIVVVLFLFTGFWPVGVMYIVAGLLLTAEPVSPFRDEKDQEFYQNYAQSRQSAIQRIKRKFDSIERRIQRMEHTVTSREFDWRQR